MTQMEVALTILLGASVLYNVLQHFMNRDLSDELHKKMIEAGRKK